MTQPRWCAIDEHGDRQCGDGPTAGMNHMLPRARCLGVQFEGMPLMLVVNPAALEWRADCVLGVGEVDRYWGLGSRDEGARTWVFASGYMVAIATTVEQAEQARDLLFG